MLDRKTVKHLAKQKSVVIESNCFGGCKSTFAKHLSELTGIPVELELGGAIDEEYRTQEYLNLFYQDKRAYAFMMQIVFLNSRFRKVLKSCREKLMIYDRTFRTDYVVAQMLHRTNLMDDSEWFAYQRHYQTISELVQQPTLTIFLKTKPEAAKRRIDARDRHTEKDGIDLGYLHELSKEYLKWLDERIDAGDRVKIVDIDAIKLENLNDYIKSDIIPIVPKRAIWG